MDGNRLKRKAFSASGKKNLAKACILCAHLGLIAWITSTVFRSGQLSNQALLANYGAIAMAAYCLFKFKPFDDA